jgi:hypothetical protein
MFTQRLLPALAVIGIASAASTSQASICSQATATVNSQADATALASCTSLSGSVVVGSAAQGTISLDGPTSIAGDLVVANATGLNGFTSSSITSIGGSFTMFQLTILSNLNLGALKSVKSINWDTLNLLSQISFGATVTKASSVIIANTFLQSIDGIALDTVDVLNINNNNRLKTFSTNVTNITQTLQISSNGQNLVLGLPNLVWAADATFSNVSSIDISSLQTVNNSLSFIGNTATSIGAPKLTTVGYSAANQKLGGLSINGNTALTNFSFPALKDVGGQVQIANNTLLVEGVTFPKLEQVSGAIDFAGNFTTPTLPAIQNVFGGFNIQSTAKIDCSTFDKQNGNVIQGKYTCITTSDVKSGVGSSTTTGSGSGTGSSPSSSSSKAAATSFGVNEAVAGLSVVGGILQMLL